MSGNASSAGHDGQNWPPGLAVRTRRQAMRDRSSGSVEAQAATHLVLVHDRVGVTVRDAGVIRQPVGALVAAQERGAGPMSSSDSWTETLMRTVYRTSKRIFERGRSGAPGRPMRCPRAAVPGACQRPVDDYNSGHDDDSAIGR